MFRVCTYPDPFSINKNNELWKIMTNNPQFCASQTLVQGMNRHYKKKSFYFIQTVQTLIDNVYADWNNNFDSDIKIYLAVSNYINTLKESNIKSSLRFNISEIVKSIKLLLMMRASKDMFNPENLSFEQNELLKIYDYICHTEEGKLFEKYDRLTLKDFNNVLSKCLLDDIINYIERETGKKVKIKDFNQAHLYLEQLKLQYQNQLSSNDIFSNSSTNLAEKIDDIKHYLDLLSKPISFETIVIHGVHKFTPLMYFLFKTLDLLGVNVVFVINYAKNFSKICDTWKKVYSWTKCKFEYEDAIVNAYNDIGRQLGNLFEERIDNKELDNKIYKFKNLTQFTDEVSSIYRDAKSKSQINSAVLSSMKTQYYAIDSEGSNKILKIYYPEQFGSKHFLSYPVGQFILNIYNMWNVKKKEIYFKFENLYECINSGIMLNDNTSKVFDISRKLEPYFPKEFNLKEFLSKINTLKSNIVKIYKDKSLELLKKISFYSLSIKDIELFENYILSLNELTKKLFEKEEFNYKSHFKTLISLIAERVNLNSSASKVEMDLINEINERLNSGDNDNIKGSVEDVQQAIFYYLSSVKETDSSNWIVRGFDQIDGGVLLSKTTKASKYHFALVSNNHLCGLKLQDLPYPLTLEMFNNYEESDSCVNVIYNCYKEARNYLRFYLFYGLMFTRKNIEISFIENEEEDRKEIPYYALSALNLPIIDREETVVHKLRMENPKTKLLDFSINSLTEEDKEIFSICPYKYVLSKVLKNEIIYLSDFHIKYYSSIFMYLYFSNKYNGRNFEEVKNDIINDLKDLRVYFDFLIQSEFDDVVRKFLDEFQFNYKAAAISNARRSYIRRKMNFLLAQWIERNENNEENRCMKFPELRNMVDLNDEIKDFMDNESTHNYETRGEFPHPKVCESCNFTEVCLRKYYEVLQDEYIDSFNGGEDE